MAENDQQVVNVNVVINITKEVEVEVHNADQVIIQPPRRQDSTEPDNITRQLPANVSNPLLQGTFPNQPLGDSFELSNAALPERSIVSNEFSVTSSTDLYTAFQEAEGVNNSLTKAAEISTQTEIETDATLCDSKMLKQLVQYDDIIFHATNNQEFDIIETATEAHLKLNPELRSISTLVTRHTNLLKLQKFESSAAVGKQILHVLKSHCYVKGSTIRRVANDLDDIKKHFEALALFQLAPHFYRAEGRSPNSYISQLRTCVEGILKCSRHLIKQRNLVVVNNYVIPMMRNLTTSIRLCKEADFKHTSLEVSKCLLYTAACEKNAGVDEYQTIKEAISLVGTIENKEHYKVYGHLLHNLGAYYSKQAKIEDAVRTLIEAREAFSKVKDWESENENQQSTTICCQSIAKVLVSG